MGGPRGAKAGAIFYSLIETCKTNDIEPYQYLCAMPHRIRECVTGLSSAKTYEHRLELNKGLQATEVQIEEAFHKLCGYDDSVPKAEGIANTKFEVLLMMVI